MTIRSLAVFGAIAAGLVSSGASAGEGDAAVADCVAFHKSNKTTTDEWTIKTTLCKEPEAREARSEISACITSIRKAGYQYANSFDVCVKNRGFGAELKQYLACYNAETKGTFDTSTTTDPSQTLVNCASKEFRDDRKAAHDCAAKADVLWPSNPGSNNVGTPLIAFNRQALVPICLDPEKKASLDDIVDCTRKLSQSAKFDWKVSDSFARDARPEEYIKSCAEKDTRDALGSMLACRNLVVSTVTEQYKQAKIYDRLVAGTRPDSDSDDRRDDSGSREDEVQQQLDKCVSDSGFRAGAAEIMACGIENVKAFGRLPFASTRYIDGSRSAYATLEAEGKCMTAEDRQYQHRAIECMTRVADRVPKGDLEQLGTMDSDPKQRVYLWCEMTIARDLGNESLKGLAGDHCSN